MGWVADDDLYLEPDAAFAAVQEMGNQVGEPQTVLSKTLNKRLAERALLRSQETERHRHTVRRVIEGARRSPHGGQTLGITVKGILEDGEDI